MQRWLGIWLVAIFAMAQAWAQTTAFTRPGTMIVIGIMGEAVVAVGDQEKALKVDERLRAEATFKTARRSTVTVEFGNGSVLKVGSNSEVVVDEFWQHPHSISGKMADWKEEPSASQTKMRLARGEMNLSVVPLKIARGSSCAIELVAGNIRITRGMLRAQVEMTELGLGICLIELLDGAADFEPVGGKLTPLPVGKRLALAVEVDPRTGAVKVSDAPKPEPAKN
jgi:hypothetical protein